MNPKPRTCSLSIAAGALGGKWKPVVLYCLLDGTKRFSELQRSIPGITQRMLAIALREAEAERFVSRTIFPEVPPRVEYTLTEKGRSLESLLISMRDWGRMYVQPVVITSDKS
jgi:DNA-binding HxlR family transcriptional regulator